MSSRLLTRGTKIKIHITLVRPVLTYGCEAWALIKTDEVALGTFEKKILCKIYGLIQERGEWRIRYNHELLPSIVKVIHIACQQWAGDLQRMKNTDIPTKLMEWKPESRRSAWRPRLRWMDGVEQWYSTFFVRVPPDIISLQLCTPKVLGT
jgi:hypothetical protein